VVIDEWATTGQIATIRMPCRYIDDLQISMKKQEVLHRPEGW
jgi:hypothetical protein